jgi:hypothetical protein
MPLFGQKTGFRARINEIKSGIPCSGCYYLLYHLAKLLQKTIASEKNQHITSHVATIFCNHLATLLQKIVASQKTNTSHAPIFCKRYHQSDQRITLHTMIWFCINIHLKIDASHVIIKNQPMLGACNHPTQMHVCSIRKSASGYVMRQTLTPEHST